MRYLAQELLISLAKLSRQLRSSRDSWNDVTRSQFDKRYFEEILSEGDLVAKRLIEIEAQISNSLRSLGQSE
jgi:hypothetical protein